MKQYFCFEHGINYTDDDLMCPKCEKEICEAHDEWYKEMKMQQFEVRDTTQLQEDSLINFMAAIGYEPTYAAIEISKGYYGERLNGFFQPKFFKTGKARVSVNTAIRMHNELAEETFAKLKFEPYVEFSKFVAEQDNVDEIIAVFAGTCKIVHTVKATYSKKKGLMINNHNVKFVTKRDKAHYGF